MAQHLTARRQNSADGCVPAFLFAGQSQTYDGRIRRRHIAGARSVCTSVALGWNLDDIFDLFDQRFDI